MSAPATILDRWSSVALPAPPELRPVRLAPRTTGFFVVDIVHHTCNATDRPGALAIVPVAARMLAQAREAGAHVLHALSAHATAEEILPEVAPLAGEPIVAGTPDKFIGTNLKEILDERGITTLVMVGTAGHGAMLHTPAGAAQRGYDAVVVLDAVGAENDFIRLANAWHLANAPLISRRVTLTRGDLVSYGAKQG